MCHISEVIFLETETVMHIRVSPRDTEFVRDMVKEGYFSNKSAAVRAGLHLLEFSFLIEDLKKMREKDSSFDETMCELKAVRKQVYKKYWK